jgi:hypothetical protein
MKTKKKIFEAPYPAHVPAERTSIWTIIHELCRFAGFSEEHPEQREQYPEIARFLADVRSAYARLSDAQTRRIEEPRIFSFTQDLAELYAEFLNKQVKQAAQIEGLKALLDRWQMTLPVSEKDAEKLTISTNSNGASEFRGPKDQAAAKAARLLRISKSQIYSFQSNPKNRPQKVGFRFLHWFTAQELTELVLDKVLRRREYAELAAQAQTKES